MGWLSGYRFQFMTLDPVHVGTGGYRLGRVDMSIVREPGTNVPKIPGTSLSGVARSYGAMTWGNLDCAGQGKHCGLPSCPICYTFGYVQGEGAGQKAHQGTVSLFDAMVTLFPVHTMWGPMWVTTWDRLRSGGFELTKDPPPPGAEEFLLSEPDPTVGDVMLNLGWLVLHGRRLPLEMCPQPKVRWEGKRWAAISGRIIIVEEALFGLIVSSNLEVRTSVSIDPQTGAARRGALFTYEAIPRATFMTADVVVDDYRGEFPSGGRLRDWQGRLHEKKLLEKFGPGTRPEEAPRVVSDTLNKALESYAKAGVDWQTPIDVVRAGFNLMEWMGVGGMGTRGFGRLAVVGEPIQVSPHAGSKAAATAGEGGHVA